jgi:hypothetical protein
MEISLTLPMPIAKIDLARAPEENLCTACAPYPGKLGFGNRGPIVGSMTRFRATDEQSERTSFETAELRLLFAAPVFNEHEYP